MYPGGTRKTSIVARLSPESGEKVTDIMTLRVEALSGHHLPRYIRFFDVYSDVSEIRYLFARFAAANAGRMTFRRFAAFYAPTRVTS